jgi:hypothetical protein
MAGAGKKTFTAGEVLTASDVNTYLMEQSVMYFGGTAARSSAIPTPSTGMTTYIGTTGTASIPQIEVYTGSAWQTPYGLTQIANVTFTTVSSISLDNVFTSRFSNYRIIFQTTAKSTNGSMYLRFRAGGSDDTNTNYNYGGVLGRTNETPAYYGGTGQQLALFGFSNTAQVFNSFDVINPQLALNTLFSSTGHGGDLSTWFSVNGSGNHFSATQFDGITFVPSTGTISGNVRVYGYRNS